MKTITRNELGKVLRSHSSWRRNSSRNGKAFDFFEWSRSLDFLGRRADLSGTDLRGLDLRQVSLHGAYLDGADLSHTRLCGADLRWAILSGADLESADLSGANLENANLEWANLRNANLSNANMYRTLVSGANLQGVIDADLEYTQYSGAAMRVLPPGPGVNLLLHGWPVYVRQATTTINCTARPNEAWLTLTEEFLSPRFAEWWRMYGEAVKDIIRGVISRAG